MDILDDNALILLALALWGDDDNEPIPQHNSAFTGHLRFIEVMQSPSIARFHDETRMDKIIFLLQLLTNGDELKGSRFISAGQKLMIFLNILIFFWDIQFEQLLIIGSTAHRRFLASLIR